MSQGLHKHEIKDHFFLDLQAGVSAFSLRFFNTMKMWASKYYVVCKSRTFCGKSGTSISIDHCGEH